MAFPELTLLGRWTNTNPSTGLGKAANTAWSPAPVQTTEPALRQGYLTSNEVAEARYLVVYAPVSSSGSIQDLRDVQLVLDGELYDYVHLNANQQFLMAPAPDTLVRGTVIELGKPTYGRNGKAAPVTDATCPKATQTISVNATAGTNGATADYTVEVWGYVYPATTLATLMPVYTHPSTVVPDPLNRRTFTIPGRTISAGPNWKAHWSALPGGTKQTVANGQAAVHKLVRWAKNQNATQPSIAYQFQYQNSASQPGVEFAYQNLFFQLTSEEAIIAQRLGAVGPAPGSTGAEILSAAIYTPSETQSRHPLGGIPAGFYRSEAGFGLVPGETNLFYGLPALPQGDQLLTDESAYVGVVDNGTSIAAGEIVVGFAGILILSGAGGVI